MIAEQAVCERQNVWCERSGKTGLPHPGAKHLASLPDDTEEPAEEEGLFCLLTTLEDSVVFLNFIGDPEAPPVPPVARPALPGVIPVLVLFSGK